MATSVPTYYDVLQVERDASPERIRTAYRRLAQKYHPDKLPDNANAARAMAAINAAYAVLSDGHRRAEHDLWIRRAERPVQRPARRPETLWAYLHPASSWPWVLLFLTLVVAIGTIAGALYLTTMPARSASAPAEAPATAVATAPRPAGAHGRH